jgi:hypothetical protein
MKTCFVSTATFCMLVASCGGSGSGNAALDKVFTYGAGTPATNDQMAVTDAELNAIVGFVKQPDLLRLFDLDGNIVVNNMIAILFGKKTLSDFNVTVGTGFSALFYDDSGCITATSAKVTLNNCTHTSSEEKGTYNGFTSLGGTGNRTLTWNFTAQRSYSGDGSWSEHCSGALTVTGSKITGKILTEAVGMVSTLCTMAGTFEAKRIQTGLPDEAVFITWAGCLNATTKTPN